jgi:DNA (cytosine-5)-methyltransferase 1
VAKYVGIELFAGIGGMSLGFSDAGFRLAAAVERDPIHAIGHATNFPKCVTIVDDVGRITGVDIRDAAGLSRSADVHVLFGGPPCQGFSFGGKKDPADPRNVGVLEFARIVRELKPLYFVLENVDGLFAPNVSTIVSMFLGLVVQAGYEVVGPVQSLEAADFRVPQWRRRAFVLGYRRGCTPPQYPAPTATRVTVSDAIADLPQFGGFDSLYGADTIRVQLTSPSAYASSLRDPDLDASDYPLTACLLSRHADDVRRRFTTTRPGEQEPVSRFFRLNLSEQATTLRAGTDISRGRFTAPRPIHPTEPRCITVREAARLHSFPDWFKFNKTIWHGFRQVGNAVPPVMARAVAQEVWRALSGKNPISKLEDE